MFCLSGLGYIVGTTVAGAFDDKWQWGLRVRYFSVYLFVFQKSLLASLLTKKKKLQSIMWYVLLPKKNYPSNLTLNLLTSKSKFKLSKLLSIYFLKEHYLRGFVSRFKWFSLRLSFCQFVYGQTTDTRLLFWTVCFFPVERKHLKVLTFSLNLPHIIWTPRQYEHFLRPSVSELLCFGHHFTVT